MAFIEALHCDEITCAKQVSVEALQPGKGDATPWTTVQVPCEVESVFDPMSGGRVYRRPYQPFHFCSWRCMALWACGMADKARAEADAAAQHERDAVGPSEWESPIPAMKAMRAARLAALRGEAENERFKRLSVWLQGGEQAA